MGRFAHLHAFFAYTGFAFAFTFSSGTFYSSASHRCSYGALYSLSFAFSLAYWFAICNTY